MYLTHLGTRIWRGTFHIFFKKWFLPAQLEKGRILSKNLGLGSKSFKRVENEVRLTLIKVSGVVPSHSSRKSFSWVEKKMINKNKHHLMCFLLIGSMLQFKSKLEAGHTCLAFKTLLSPLGAGKKNSFVHFEHYDLANGEE
jgi:hypothetical protein